jgi:hypothetical protein
MEQKILQGLIKALTLNKPKNVVHKVIYLILIQYVKMTAEMESSSRANNVILETVGSGLSAKMDCLIPDVPLVACSSEGFTQAMTKRAM